MPIRLDIKRKLSARSERVKAVDLHPKEPWILTALYNGQLHIWNYKTQSSVKSFEVGDLPIRAAKFIVRKQQVICGADDMNLRVFNYNTMEKVKTWEGHQDYIRAICVHPNLPYVLTSADDMTIRLWDWDKNWQLSQIFEGHSHYVMQIAINPKDSNSFATASLDKTVKVWGLTSKTPHFTLEGHEKGVNCLAYFLGGDKPYLVSGSDDRTVKIWDYQTKACVHTLEGHSHNITSVGYHPELPLIMTGSEDGTVRIWHSSTYHLEKTLNYGMERVWCMAMLEGTNGVALGYDEGTIFIKLGREEPPVSMDSTGKLLWAVHNEIYTGRVKAEAGVEDGAPLTFARKAWTTCDIYPQRLLHSANGRFVAVYGGGEYSVSTALSWRPKNYGAGLNVVWNQEAAFAVRESSFNIKVFNDFKEVGSFNPTFTSENIFGGQLLSVRGSSFVVFYDWTRFRVVRKIDVTAKDVIWNEAGELVCIACENSFFILRYNKAGVEAFFDAGGQAGEEGLEDSFEVLQEFGEKIRGAVWAGDCLIYTNTANRLNYCVGSETVTVAHLDKKLFLLGYQPKDNRVYLTDRDLTVVSFTLHLAIINYQTAVIRGDFEAANKLLPKIPESDHNRIAQFLESRGYPEEALALSKDADHRFDLALRLGKIDLAQDIAKQSDSDQKWRQLGDVAMSSGDLVTAARCLQAADDLSGLLLLYTSLGDLDGVKRLGAQAKESGKFNLAFMCAFLTHNLGECLDLLVSSERLAEAVLFARTYAPSHVDGLLPLWKKQVAVVNKHAAEALAVPAEYPNLFPDFDWAKVAQGQLQREAPQPAAAYSDLAGLWGTRQLIEEAKEIHGHELPSLDLAAAPAPVAAAPAPTPVSAAAPASPAPAPASPLPSATPPASPVKPAATPASPAPADPDPDLPELDDTPLPTPVPVPGTPTPNPAPAVSPSPSPAPVANPPDPDLQLDLEDDWPGLDE